MNDTKEVTVNQDVQAGDPVVETQIQTKIIREHRVFFYRCRRCQKKRSSYKKTIAHAGICRLCRKNKVPENQISLFGFKINI